MLRLDLCRVITDDQKITSRKTNQIIKEAIYSSLTRSRSRHTDLGLGGTVTRVRG